MLVFQTGRQIGSAYQVIEAVTTPLGVVFTDLATNVVGLICGPMTKANIMTAYDTGTYTNFSKVERTMPDQMPEPTSFVTLYTLFVEDPDDTGDYGYWDESEEIVDNPGTFVETLEELDDLLKTIPRRYAVTVLELRKHSVMPVYVHIT